MLKTSQQNLYKPMAAHPPKITNPFANAKPMGSKIHTFATQNNPYFSNVWNSVKETGNDMANIGKSVYNTADKAVKGWGTLLDGKIPFEKRTDYLKKGLKSVRDDFFPGVVQGAVNLPTDALKGTFNLGAGVVNTLTGGKFTQAKNNVNTFLNKVTSPFQIDMSGKRTGVNSEAFNIGQVAGNVASSVGVSAATPFARTTFGAAADKVMSNIPTAVSSRYAKTITKLTGDPYPITGPERALLRKAKEENLVYRGDGQQVGSHYSVHGIVMSNTAVKNRNFYNIKDVYDGNVNNTIKQKGLFDRNIVTANNNAIGSVIKEKNIKRESGLWRVPPENRDVSINPPKKGAIFIDKGPSKNEPMFNSYSERLKYKVKDSPVTVLGHEYGHAIDHKAAMSPFKDYTLTEKVKARFGKGGSSDRYKRLKGREQGANETLRGESAANLNNLNFLKSNSKWYNPTNFFRESRLESRYLEPYGSYQKGMADYASPRALNTTPFGKPLYPVRPMLGRTVNAQATEN